jgi:hypothetical protein
MVVVRLCLREPVMMIVRVSAFSLSNGMGVIETHEAFSVRSMQG